MDDNSIRNLREALKYSPDNVPLRLHLAESLANAGRFKEAEQEYYELFKLSDEPKIKVGLADVFFKKGEHSKCIVVLEELFDNGQEELHGLVLYTRALLKDGSMQNAIESYKKVLRIDPNFQDEELDQELRRSNQGHRIELEEEALESGFIQKPSIKFEDVGGMEEVKKEIDLKIIKPILHQDLYKAYGKKTGGGILLYGPPGCGKTYIARATAGQVNAKFINVGLNDILDMWVGNSEKNLHHYFELARQNTPCVLFFDEIDALGASRSDMKQSSGRHLINQFLLELDGVEHNNDGILIIGATNTPWHLDAAFRRPGRFDRILFIPPPDEPARASIFRIKLKGKPVDTIDHGTLAKKLENYSGADIEALIDIAIESKLEESFKDGVPRPITTSDLLTAAKKHKPSTQEWFATAKNYALFANDSGLYDDILKHLNIKK